jgi:hypothetical protein
MAGMTLSLGVWLSVGENPPARVGTAEVEAQLTTTEHGVTIHAGAALTKALHQAADAIAEVCPNHQARQHRDGKEPWCNECHLTEDGREPHRHRD